MKLIVCGFLVLFALAVSGCDAQFDTGCYTEFGNGCIPGKGIRIK